MYEYAYVGMSVYQCISVGTSQECKVAFTVHRGLGSTTGRRQDRSPAEFPVGSWTEAPEGVFTRAAEGPFNVHIVHSWGQPPRLHTWGALKAFCSPEAGGSSISLSLYLLVSLSLHI